IVAVPRVLGKDMVFVRIRELSGLKRSRFGILEPEDLSNTLDAAAYGREWTLDLVPGLAFDRELNRVGYGGGYYDRFMASFPRTFHLALAFHFQLLEACPHEPFDVRPRALLTEKELIRRDGASFSGIGGKPMS
nr:5-formyltetrahydrofolate cyclo-ligase [Lachnospiraceae bacterium]